MMVFEVVTHYDFLLTYSMKTILKISIYDIYQSLGPCWQIDKISTRTCKYFLMMMKCKLDKFQ